MRSLTLQHFSISANLTKVVGEARNAVRALPKLLGAAFTLHNTLVTVADLVVGLARVVDDAGIYEMSVKISIIRPS